MLLLAIDTCGSLGTAALARLGGEEVEILDEAELPGKTWSARLVPTVRGLLAAHAATAAGLEGIVVTSGPGSFTGIRIALGTAKGLAEVHSVPIVAVSRLAVLAHKGRVRAAALDASRGEFYFGDYTSGAREVLLPGESFAKEAATLGENLALCQESALAPAARLFAAPTAADALRFAVRRIRSRDYDDPVTLDGNYLRRSDAEIFSRPKLLSAVRS